MQMPKLKRYVISGAPGSGKTALINAFNADAVCCFEEISRSITAEAQNHGKEQPFLTDPVAFSSQLFKGRLAQYNHPQQAAYHLYDRGIHDVIAYLEGIGADYPQDYVTQARIYTYDKVFLLPPWEDIYTQDAERYETFEQAVEIHKHLTAVYNRFAMPIIEVPKATVEQRIEFIKLHF